MSAPRAAAVQMVSTDDVEANLRRARALLEDAREAGAALAVLPENFPFMAGDERAKLDHAEPEAGGPVTAFLREEAARLGLWLVGGTVPYAAGPDRVRAACLLVDDRGEIRARYDKIHLFDVQLEGGEGYRESATIAPGDRPVVADTPCGPVGLAVCYDLRFPELFRALVDAGAEWLAVPAAFTRTTGAAHWEVLVRARAIEEQVTVVAADQGGVHPGGRETYGHSMVVDPWGAVLDRVETGEGLALGPVDRDHIARVRRQLPALAHRRWS
ncbi:carbon-nitrogen hydrolase family protein [Thiohalorhabdus denitrificans]|uniref:Nitrilase n=1 Tax=Thiohalorhabdus denitrificans TaxID=381306 RepID=A0A1G5EDB1_9GAMM|nr:carbon-nitrogen hydrolase family protein [Thiohalorhabdus denitrificans]SCY24917.1 nitrilase [Thiohalorhabdus denitrificans]